MIRPAQSEAYTIEYLCHDGQTWRPVTTDSGAELRVTNRQEAEAMAEDIYRMHGRPARVLDSDENTVRTIGTNTPRR